MDTSPRLIVDAMLGSLAKWLRIMGFDTLYFRDISDNELVRLGRKEDRLLLTKDTGIARGARPGECLLIRSEKTVEQLREVISATGGSSGRIVKRSGMICPIMFTGTAMLL